MGFRRLGIAAMWACVFFGGTAGAGAHARDYILNQQYYTARQGEFEVEFHNDYNLPEAHHDGTFNSKHQIELEYGITNNLQVAYYEVYTWDREQDWERDEFKLETKYRFAEAGQWPADVALYLEYANPDGHRDVHSDVLEGKLVVSKDFGPWNVIGNAVVEKELNEAETWELEYTAGVSYGVTPRTRAGLELKHGLGGMDDLDFSEDQEIQVMPGIYHSFSPHVRVLVGPAFGLTKSADDFQFRSIVELEF